MNGFIQEPVLKKDVWFRVMKQLLISVSQLLKMHLINQVLKPEDIDLVIAASSAPPQLYPAIACHIQSALGIPNYAPAFDITAACSGLIYGLQIARGFIGSGLYKKILIVATDNNSRLVDWADRGVSILFGDGAGAMVVTEAEDGVDDILCFRYPC